MKGLRRVLFTTLFNLAVLVFLWRDGDVGLVAKVILTVVSLAIWVLILWTPAAVMVAQCLLIAIIGTATFGVEWLNQRIR